MNIMNRILNLADVKRKNYKQESINLTKHRDLSPGSLTIIAGRSNGGKPTLTNLREEKEVK